MKSNKTMSFRPTSKEKKEIERMATKQGISRAKIIENIVKQHLKKEPDKTHQTEEIINVTQETTTINKMFHINNTNVEELKQEVTESISLPDVSIKNNQNQKEEKLHLSKLVEVPQNIDVTQSIILRKRLLASLPDLDDMDLPEQIKDTSKVLNTKNIGLPSLEEVDAAKKQEIIKCIETHIKKMSFMDIFWGYDAWYIGITEKPKVRKQQHGHPLKWGLWELSNPITAREIEKHFLDKGMKGNSGGGTNTIYVYVF